MQDMLMQPAGSIAAAIRRGEVTAAEVMAATLERIAAVNPRVNAVVSLADPERLMAAARAADAAGPEARGPLHGLPLAVKDLANAAGFPTSMGSPILAGQAAVADDIHVARLRAAGAIVLGKTNTPEFGLGSHTVNPVFGATRNAFDPSRSAGGSSGGAAVALATGMVPLADGSDMMGSLRNPAGWNGVYGLRPSWGRVPSEPLGETFLHQLSTNGPMGRSPGDLALMLSVLSGRDPRQPHGVPAETFAPPEPARRVRIGWLGDWGGALPMAEGVLAACEAALGRLGGGGVTVAALAAPFPREALWEAWTVLRSWAIAGSLGALHADPLRRERLKATAVWEVERGLALSAMAVQRASLVRSDWFRVAARLFEEWDVLALPTAQLWPFPVEWDYPREIAGVAMDTYHRWMEVVVPASLIGLPALAVPGIRGPEGQPMGLQLIGPRGSEARLLALGQRWHEAIVATP